MNEEKIINGKEIAKNLREEIAKQVTQLKETHNITPGLAVVLVGEDPASQVYVRNKGKQTTESGMNSFEFKLPDNVSEADLIAKIEELNNDDKVNAILVQLPLPSHISENAVINSIAPEKDVDGFHIINSGLLATGQDATVPCTPLGCILMLKQKIGDLSGLNALVVGRSNIVGKPMASLLLQESCTVTIAHSRTKNLAQQCLQADIIVAAVGVPEIIKGDWVKKGASVIDVGINRVEKPDGGYKLIGDVEFDEAIKNANFITPVPGGVGPMTIACLLKNTLRLTFKQNKLLS